MRLPEHSYAASSTRSHQTDASSADEMRDRPATTSSSGARPDEEALERCREGLRVETPQSPADRHALWGREGDAGGAGLSTGYKGRRVRFFGDAGRGSRRGGGGTSGRGRRGDRPPLRMYLFFVFSLWCDPFPFSTSSVFFSSLPSFSGSMGYRGLGSPTMTAGFCAARGPRGGSPVGDGICSWSTRKPGCRRGPVGR